MYHNNDIGKVGHHGSKNGTGESLLNVVQPKLALISAGANNRYGHPHEETLERLEQVGSTIYSTTKQGQITIAVEKEKAYVETYKGKEQ